MRTPQPEPIGTITFNADFQAISQEGTPGQSEELAIFLPTLLRSASTCGEILEMGSLTLIEGWGCGEGFRFTASEEQARFTRWKQVFMAGFASEEAQHLDDSHFPLLGWQSHLKDYLAEQPGVIWIGFRDSETNQWDQKFLLEGLGPEMTQKATMMVLQADILLKGHGLPRQRTHLVFESGSLSFWAASNDNYLMVASNGDSPNLPPALVRSGEAFLIGAIS